MYNKEYRPILVFYVQDRELIEDQILKIKKYAEDNEYDVLIWDKAKYERLEIVAIDKQTFVTDIQQWINNEIQKNNK